MTADDNKCTLITSAEIKILIPYSPQQIKRMEDDGRFPNRLRLGPNKICWVKEEVENWLEERLKDRRGEKLSDQKNRVDQFSEIKKKVSKITENISA
jgi:prophage regulatory protein